MITFKRLLLILFVIFTVMITHACAQEPVVPELEAISIYDVSRDTAYPLLEGHATYRAQHGYTLKQEQGYNHWYYYAGSGIDNLKLMRLKNEMWVHGSATIYDRLLHPTDDTAVARVFIAPESGEATVYGTIRMFEEATGSVKISIYHNETKIYPETGERMMNGHDTTGYFHRHQIQLVTGDRLTFLVETDDGTSGHVSWNPVVDYLNQEEEYLHYAMTDYVGDVHPYYDNGKLYMYYLALDGNFSSSLAISQDMVTFTDQTLETTRLNAPGSFYYVLGVTREGGYYYSFYGEGKNVGSSRSTDLILWESGIVWDEETYEKLYSPSSNYPAGTRDPYAYFNPDLNKYHIVATGYRANEHYPWSNTTGYDAYIVLYTSTGPSLAEWEKNPVTGRAGYHRPLLHFGDWVNHPEIGDPECPQIVKIGDYWYILASLAGRGGDHWVGRPSYWIGDPGVDILDVDWQSRIGDEHFLDGEDLCAAQIVEIEGKHYLFGWITQRNVSGGWGGTLNLIREVYPDEEGRLFVRLEPELIAKINAGKIIDLAEMPVNTTSGFAYGESIYSVSSIASQNGYDHYARLDMPGTYGRTFIEIEGNVNASSEAMGITISKNQDVEIGIRQRLGQWEIFLKNAGVNGKVSATQAIEIDASGDVNIQIVIEGNVAEVFVDGRYALAARAGMSLSDDVGISVFAAGLETSIKTMSVNHLTSRLDYGY